jgi:hypothetical protein
MEVSGGKNIIPVSLDISPLLFHIVSKLVQALVITYDEIFQALAVKRDVLLLKLFLDLGVDNVIRWKSPASDVFFQFAKHVKVEGSESGLYGGCGGVQKWLREQGVVSFYRQGLANLIVCYDKCLNKFGNYVEKQRTVVQRYRVFLLST